MMTVSALYRAMEEKIPPSLSCEWDNDGLMCCPDREKPIRRVLVALDATAAVAEKAAKEGYDLIVTHHPMIFHPLKALDPADPIARKTIRLLLAGVSVMSFHTRLDAAAGGVNDVLASALGLTGVTPFGPEGEEIGRVGTLPEAVTLRAFAQTVKRVTGADGVQVSDAGRPVRRVAVLGGSGGDEISFAAASGADTYLSGELKHDQLTEAPERGMNLVAAGHFFTENLVCERLRELLLGCDPGLTVDVTDSNPVRLI